MRVCFKLYGVFRTAAGTNDIQLELPPSANTVKTAITELTSRPEYAGIKPLLFAGETTDPRPNALIMISGREIGTLGGLNTALNESDELSLLPIAHGG